MIYESPPEGWELYELANPSDPYHFFAPTPEVACYVAISVGSGKCGAIRVSDQHNAGGIYMFGHDRLPGDLGLEGFDATVALNAFVEEHACEIEASLKTMLIGGATSHEIVDEALEGKGESDRESFLETWHDKKKSSMADFKHNAEVVVKWLESRPKGLGGQT